MNGVWLGGLIALVGILMVLNRDHDPKPYPTYRVTPMEAGVACCPAASSARSSRFAWLVAAAVIHR